MKELRGEAPNTGFLIPVAFRHTATLLELDLSLAIFGAPP